MESNETWIDDRVETVWRSEFVECRYERANNTLVPQLCLDPNQMFCCYNNALLDAEHLCCSFTEFLLEHRALLNLIHLCFWSNLLIIVLIIIGSIVLMRHSKQIIDEEDSDNRDLMDSIQNSKDKKKLVESLKETLSNI